MLRLRLLGSFEIERAGRVELSRLPSRAAPLLLARPALHPKRQHPREARVELLWPGVALDVGRNRLRQTLPTLRALLETDEAPRAGPRPHRQRCRRWRRGHRHAPGAGHGP